MIPPTAEMRWADSFWGYAWLRCTDKNMNLMTRILIAIVACMLIMTGCQKSTKREIMVLSEMTQQTDNENEILSE